MNKIDASVFIITLNEERHIDRALRSVTDFAHVVVVDSGSTDETLNIARQHTTHVVHHEFENYAAQKNYALSLCKKEYALTLDADEEVTPHLLAELRAFMVAPDADGLVIARRDRLLGIWQHPGSHHQQQIRFVRTETAHFTPGLVHESIKIEGKVRRAKGIILHYADDNISARLAKIDHYSQLRAQEKHAVGRTPSLLKLIFVGPLIFLKTLLFRRYFLNGRNGFILSMLNGHYAFLKEARLFEARAKKADES